MSNDDEDFLHEESEAVPTKHNVDQNDIAPPAKKRKVYSAEEISETVKMCVEGKMSASVVAKQKGIPPSTIHTWIKKANKTLPTNQIPLSSNPTTKQPPTPSKPQNKLTHYFSPAKDPPPPLFNPQNKLTKYYPVTPPKDQEFAGIEIAARRPLDLIQDKPAPDNVAPEDVITLEDDWLETNIPVDSQPGSGVGPGLGSLLQEIRARRRPGVDGVLDSLLQESTVQELVESGGWRAFRTGVRQRMERGVKRSNNQNDMIYLESGVRSKPRWVTVCGDETGVADIVKKPRKAQTEATVFHLRSFRRRSKPARVSWSVECCLCRSSQVHPGVLDIRRKSTYFREYGEEEGSTSRLGRMSTTGRAEAGPLEKEGLLAAHHSCLYYAAAEGMIQPEELLPPEEQLEGFPLAEIRLAVWESEKVNCKRCEGPGAASVCANLKCLKSGWYHYPCGLGNGSVQDGGNTWCGQCSQGPRRTQGQGMGAGGGNKGGGRKGRPTKEKTRQSRVAAPTYTDTMSSQELFFLSDSAPGTLNSVPSTSQPSNLGPYQPGPSVVTITSDTETERSRSNRHQDASKLTNIQSIFSGYLSELLQPLSVLDILEELEERERERKKDLKDPLRCVNVTRVQHIDKQEFEENSQGGILVVPEKLKQQSSPRTPIVTIHSSKANVENGDCRGTENKVLEKPIILDNIRPSDESGVMLKKQLEITKSLLKSKRKEFEQLEYDKEEIKSQLEKKDSEINTMNTELIELRSKEATARQREESAVKVAAEQAKKVEQLQKYNEALQRQLTDQGKKMTKQRQTLTAIKKLAEEDDIKEETVGEYVEEGNGEDNGIMEKRYSCWKI